MTGGLAGAGRSPSRQGPNDAPQVHEDGIEAIWKTHGLGRVRSILAATSGVQDETYIVIQERVVRFNTRDPQVRTFRRVLERTSRVRSARREPGASPDHDRPRRRARGRSLRRHRRDPAAGGERDRKPRCADGLLARRAGIGRGQEPRAYPRGFTFDAFGARRSLADGPFRTRADYVRDHAQACCTGSTHPARHAALNEQGRAASGGLRRTRRGAPLGAPSSCQLVGAESTTPVEPHTEGTWAAEIGNFPMCAAVPPGRLKVALRDLARLDPRGGPG